jgi:hypothetical protein
LILNGIFQSIFWKMNPRLRWLSEHYRLIRTRACSSSANAPEISGQAPFAAGFRVEGSGSGTASVEATQRDLQADSQQTLNNARHVITRLSSWRFRIFCRRKPDSEYPPVQNRKSA